MHDDLSTRSSLVNNPLASLHACRPERSSVGPAQEDNHVFSGGEPGLPAHYAPKPAHLAPVHPEAHQPAWRAPERLADLEHHLCVDSRQPGALRMHPRLHNSPANNQVALLRELLDQDLVKARRMRHGRLQADGERHDEPEAEAPLPVRTPGYQRARGRLSSRQSRRTRRPKREPRALTQVTADDRHGDTLWPKINEQSSFASNRFAYTPKMPDEESRGAPGGLGHSRYIKLINDLGDEESEAHGLQGRARGWQTRTAARVGVSPEFLSRVLTGKRRKVGVGTMQKAAARIGFDVAYFTGPTDSYHDYISAARSPSSSREELLEYAKGVLRGAADRSLAADATQELRSLLLRQPAVQLANDPSPSDDDPFSSAVALASRVLNMLEPAVARPSDHDAEETESSVRVKGRAKDAS